MQRKPTTLLRKAGKPAPREQDDPDAESATADESGDQLIDA
jgi:hypothetical protein